MLLFLWTVRSECPWTVRLIAFTTSGGAGPAQTQAMTPEFATNSGPRQQRRMNDAIELGPLLWFKYP
jgi:hypothetical protein